MRRISALLMVPILALSLGMTGCSGLSTAQRTETVIQAVVATMQAEVSLIPAADQAAYNGYVTLLGSLDSQLETCITKVTGLMGMGTKPKFLACFSVFAQGATSPAELAALHVISTTSQNKVTSYIAAIIAGVNIALSFFGGTTVTPPTVSAWQPSQDDILAILRKADVNFDQDFRAVYGQ